VVAKQRLSVRKSLDLSNKKDMLESDGEVQAKNTQNAKQSSKIPSLNKRLKL